MKKRYLLIPLGMVLAVLAVIIAVHLATTLTPNGNHGTNTYAIEHSQSGSNQFTGGKFNDYAYYYQLSTDTDFKNEVRIFSDADKGFYEAIGITQRYKSYLSATSDKPVGSVYFQMPTSYKDDIHTVLLYFSNNKDKISKCVYQTEYKDGEVTEANEVTEEVQQNHAFTIVIPCVINQGQTEIKIKKASFYDKSGNLIFEDVPLENEYTINQQ